MKTLLITLFTLTLFSFPVKANQIEFHPGSFASARKQAAESQKPLLVAFTASWSSSCRRMQQLVFTNDQLADFVNPRYVAVQIDVDDFDGLALKERYRIKELPTFLAFDEKGNFRSRSEGEMTADQMRRWLSDFSPQATLTARGQATDKAVQTMSAPRSEAPTKKVEDPKQLPPDSGGTLYELDVRPVPARGYSVQLGVFSTLDNASHAMLDFRKKADSSLNFLLYAREEQGSDRYKILTGRFSTRSEAQELVNRLARKGVKGFVKPLQDL